MGCQRHRPKFACTPQWWPCYRCVKSFSGGIWSAPILPGHSSKIKLLRTAPSLPSSPAPCRWEQVASRGEEVLAWLMSGQSGQGAKNTKAAATSLPTPTQARKKGEAGWKARGNDSRSQQGRSLRPHQVPCPSQNSRQLCVFYPLWE